MADENNKIDRKFIPSLREGVDMVRMIFFKRLREDLVQKYPDEDSASQGMLAAAVMNELFGTPNPEPRFAKFREDNSARINKELAAVAEMGQDIRIPLTDALRVHFLCNVQEGLESDEATVLAKAQELGILLVEREVPLPKGFMKLVHRLGQAHGFIKSD